jgi:rubrerythrin
MHDGCAGSFTSGQEVVDKLRMMGFEGGMLPDALELACHHCGEKLTMITYEYHCPQCKAVHGVTPCHAFDAQHVQCAGPGY